MSNFSGSSDVLTDALHQLKRKISEMEKEVAHGNFDDLYKLGRAQGKIDGMEISINILEGRIEEYLDT